MDFGPQIRQGERCFISESRVRAGHETSTPVEIHIQIGGVESNRVPLETYSVEGQEGGRIERRAQGIQRRGQYRRRWNFLVDRFGRLLERRLDLGRVGMISCDGRAMLETQLAARCKNEDATELPSVSLYRRLTSATSQRTNRIPDQLGRRHLATPAPETRRAVGMQIGVDEQSPLDLEFFAKRQSKIAVSVSHDHDVDILSRPRLHRVTQLRDLLTAKESTEVAQEDQNDRPVPPEVAKANGFTGIGIDQCDRRETSRTTQGILPSDGSGGDVSEILA